VPRSGATGSGTAGNGPACNRIACWYRRRRALRVRRRFDVAIERSRLPVDIVRAGAQQKTQSHQASFCACADFAMQTAVAKVTKINSESRTSRLLVALYSRKIMLARPRQPHQRRDNPMQLGCARGDKLHALAIAYDRTYSRDTILF
jgi:hypothetical protein